MKWHRNEIKKGEKQVYRSLKKMPKVRQNESYLGFLSYLRHFVLSGNSSTGFRFATSPPVFFPALRASFATIIQRRRRPGLRQRQ
ncbi:MAG: hypothetical protein J6M41_09275 [Prevotella sp.]|nr:hypothetical protein [Prevotella sp.]